MGSSQGQKAGANSQQVQVAGDLVVVQGITEERANQIAEQKMREVIAEYAAEAQDIAGERIGRFDRELVGTLQSSGHLGIFADPAFQVLLKKAQIGAASTERESDYEILSRLLGLRAERTDRPARAGLDRAVQVVDLLDEQALVGITALHIFLSGNPGTGFVESGIDQMEQLIAPAMTGSLMDGNSWIDHMDTLDIVRMVPAATPRTFAEIWTEKVPGYMCAGIEYTSDAYLQLISPSVELGLDLPSLMFDHELRPGYKRFASTSLTSLTQNVARIGRPEVEAFLLELARNMGLGSLEAALIPTFIERVDQRPNLNALHTWYDSIPYAFLFTGVGRLIARANFKRHAPPELAAVIEV